MKAWPRGARRPPAADALRRRAADAGRVRAAADAARAGGFAAVSANDHLVFQTPWLDGPSALASVIERSGELELATTIALPVLRGPVALAKTLAALDVLSEGRVIAGVGPGSSERDYRPRSASPSRTAGSGSTRRSRRYGRCSAGGALRALLSRRRPIPLWIGSWGSRAGLARVDAAGPTAGSRPPTTRRRSASPRPARR